MGKDNQRVNMIRLYELKTLPNRRLLVNLKSIFNKYYNTAYIPNSD